MTISRSLSLKLIFILAIPSVLSACSAIKKIFPVHSTRSDIAGSASGAHRDDGYAHALEVFRAEKYEQAVSLFEEFIKENPTSKFSMAATYHLGRSYEALGVWSMAIKNYRFVITHQGSSRTLNAQSLYRLSFCYEAIGDTTKTVATLLETDSRKQDLPFEVAEAEVPARLAAAYSRIGNEKEALRYYAVAESGIAKLQRQSVENSDKWLPKALFYMGMITDLEVTFSSFEYEIMPLKKAQLYLLRAAELKDKVWSKKAADRLKVIYEAFWRAIKTLPQPSIGDEVLAKKEQQEQQWKMAHSLLVVVDEFQNNKLPGGEDVQYVSQIFQYAADYGEQIRQFLNSQPVGAGLTPEAAEREGLFRSGRTQSGKTLLEKDLSKDRDLPTKKNSQDPNL